MRNSEMAIEKSIYLHQKEIEVYFNAFKLTGMYGKIMQFSGVIWKFILCRVISPCNIYILVETHVTRFYCTIKYFPYILLFCEQNQFEILTHFLEYKILFSLVQFFLYGYRRIIRIMNAHNTKLYANLYFLYHKASWR